MKTEKSPSLKLRLLYGIHDEYISVSSCREGRIERDGDGEAWL